MTKVILKVRECDTCGAKAVALEGEGTACNECETGVFVREVDWKEIRTSPEVAEEYSEHFESEIINVSGN